MPAARVTERLMSEHGIFTVVRTIAGRDVVRVTPHLFTTMAQLDLLVSAIEQIASAR